MIGHTRGWPAFCLLCLATILVACGDVAPATSEPSVLERAAAEATLIVQRAQATAMVLSAQATATAVYRQQAATATAAPQATSTAPAQTTTATPAQGSDPAEPEDVRGKEDPPPTPPATEVEVLSVGFAAERGLINVRFRAPPEVAEKWWPGNVYVVDEQSEVVYNEIPVMPRVGPLIGRPKMEGQLGYVMLVNPPPFLRSGAQVTVVLGNYRFEHVPVQ